MEKEGLARSIEFLHSNDLQLDTIVTDRHVQIRKWVRENMGDTKHCVDVWHVAKGNFYFLSIINKIYSNLINVL